MRISRSDSGGYSARWHQHVIAGIRALWFRCGAPEHPDLRPDGTRELAHPGGVDGAQQRGVDDEASERIDESHIWRGDAAHGSASAQLLGTGAGFELSGGFTLGATSDGIDPSSEAVTIQFGTSTIAIPAGSFGKNRRGTYAFEGTVGDVSVDARIAPGGTGSYSLQVEASGADLSGTTDPVTVGLTIGNDTGTTTVAAGSD